MSANSQDRVVVVDKDRKPPPACCFSSSHSNKRCEWERQIGEVLLHDPVGSAASAGPPCFTHALLFSFKSSFTHSDHIFSWSTRWEVLWVLCVLGLHRLTWLTTWLLKRSNHAHCENYEPTNPENITLLDLEFVVLLLVVKLHRHPQHFALIWRWCLSSNSAGRHTKIHSSDMCWSNQGAGGRWQPFKERAGLPPASDWIITDSPNHSLLKEVRLIPGRMMDGLIRRKPTASVRLALFIYWTPKHNLVDLWFWYFYPCWDSNCY